MRRAKSEWCRSLSGMPDRAVHLRAVPRPPQVLWPRRSSVRPQLVPRSISRPPPGPLDTQPSDAMTHQHRRCAVAPLAGAVRISNDEDDNEARCGNHLMQVRVRPGIMWITFVVCRAGEEEAWPCSITMFGGRLRGLCLSAYPVTPRQGLRARDPFRFFAACPP